MNILINFSLQKTGGGQNVAINFLNSLKNLEPIEGMNFFFLVVKESELDNLLVNFSSNVIYAPKAPATRIVFELFKLPNIIKRNSIDLIYTYFGYTINFTKVKQVSGIAVSNIFFPEIDFWEDSDIINWVKHLLIDNYRKFGIKMADGLIFENQAMLERAKNLYNISNEKLIFISPSVDSTIKTNELVSYTSFEDLNILIVSGWHTNKNLLILPKVIAFLKFKFKNVKLTLTVSPNDSQLSKNFISLCQELDVLPHINFIGGVRKEELAKLYNNSDCILLLSKLESFSNNIIESWAFGTPLIISNEEWAKSICGDAAIYVDRKNPQDISDKILFLKSSLEFRRELLLNAKNKLSCFHSVENKTQKEILFIKEICSNQ